MEIVIPLSPKIVLVALFVLLTEHCLDEEVYFYPFRLATVIHISILLGNMVVLFNSVEVSHHALAVPAEEPLSHAPFL